MCEACRPTRNHRLAKASDAEETARQTFIEEFTTQLEGWHGDLLSALRDGAIILAAREAARRTVARTLDAHREAIASTFETLWLDGADASRAATARRYDLDVSDDLSDRVTRELQSYADDAWSETSETMVLEITDALRDAHDDGLGVPEIERILREDVFPDMRSWEAERAARTSATGAAGRGAVSSIRDAGAPGKEWLAEEGPRTSARSSQSVLGIKRGGPATHDSR